MSVLWKDVVGYEGRYQVSTDGQVRNMNWRSPGRVRNLTPCRDKDGYLQVCLSDGNGHQKSYRVHRLVAEAFLDTFQSHLEVNHKDENKTNNSLDNLECLTPYRNCNYGTRNARMALAKRNVGGKKIRQLTLDGVAISVWESGHEINRQLGFDDGLISKVCRGKKKSAYGYRWEYANE